VAHIGMGAPPARRLPQVREQVEHEWWNLLFRSFAHRFALRTTMCTASYHWDASASSASITVGRTGASTLRQLDLSHCEIELVAGDDNGAGDGYGRGGDSPPRSHVAMHSDRPIAE
jgi:hypothetical protein